MQPNGKLAMFLFILVTLVKRLNPTQNRLIKTRLLTGK